MMDNRAKMDVSAHEHVRSRVAVEGFKTQHQAAPLQEPQNHIILAATTLARPTAAVEGALLSGDRSKDL